MLEVYALNVEMPLQEDYKNLFLQQVSEEKRHKIGRYRRERDGQRTLMGKF